MRANVKFPIGKPWIFDYHNCTTQSIPLEKQWNGHNDKTISENILISRPFIDRGKIENDFLHFIFQENFPVCKRLFYCVENLIPTSRYNLAWFSENFFFLRCAADGVRRPARTPGDGENVRGNANVKDWWLDACKDIQFFFNASALDLYEFSPLLV